MLAQLVKRNSDSMRSLPGGKHRSSQEQERAALEWAEAVTLIAERVPDEVHERTTRYFDEVQIVALTMAIVATNAWNRLVTAFQRAGRHLSAAASARVTLKNHEHAQTDDELAEWFPLLSPPADYEEEAAFMPGRSRPPPTQSSSLSPRAR